MLLLLLTVMMTVTFSYALSGDIYGNVAEHRLLRVSNRHMIE